MNARTRSYVLFALAALALLAALRSIAAIRDARGVHASRTATAAALEKFAADAARRDATRLDAAAAGFGTPVEFLAGAATAVPGLVLKQTKAERTGLGQGWALRTLQVAGEDVSFAEAGRVIEWAENQQPPWRLAACELTAAGPGRGRATLTFQALEREGALRK